MTVGGGQRKTRGVHRGEDNEKAEGNKRSAWKRHQEEDRKTRGVHRGEERRQLHTEHLHFLLLHCLVPQLLPTENH